jgi:hypothetical protein
MRQYVLAPLCLVNTVIVHVGPDTYVWNPPCLLVLLWAHVALFKISSSKVWVGQLPCCVASY